ncbi:MAG: S41 family peptidase, partial [Actinomycetota bacterium]|nr:S41 family peptidase [Actinomycetota bacterium]
WNGIPMDRAVELNAARQAGSNLDARHARGLNTMTVRPLRQSVPPDEEWVVVGYSGADGQARESRVEWRIFEPPPSPTATDPDSASDPLALAIGIDAETEEVRRARKSLFSPEAMDVERQVRELASAEGLAPGAGPPGMADVSTLPDVLQFRAVSTPHGEFGYLRIRTFSVDDVDVFVTEVVRILGLLPQRGLIVDVRGNGGGIIMAGERLLQLFTPRRIEPERLHFLNTPLTLRLCQSVPAFAAWSDSIAESVETATTFSDGFPVFPAHADDCNAIGQQYHGPAVLLIDPLCYSTTDILIAGWQDHAIGPIVGTGGNTGAGGANVWTHALLANFLAGPDSPIQPLPRGTSFRVAVRRTTRVGERSGDPVEDLGVVPDQVHPLTRNDLLSDNVDLLARAGQLLASRPARTLAAETMPGGDGSLVVKVTTEGISRLDAFVDGRPRHTLDVSDGTATFEIQAQPGPSSMLELLGFDGGELVAGRRLRL